MLHSCSMEPEPNAFVFSWAMCPMWGCCPLGHSCHGSCVEGGQRWAVDMALGGSPRNVLGGMALELAWSMRHNIMIQRFVLKAASVPHSTCISDVSFKHCAS